MTDPREIHDDAEPGPTQAASHADPISEHAPPLEPGPARDQPRGAPAWDPNRYRRPDPRVKSPFLAAVMSLVPGLGQIYVGYYKKGFINPLVVGGLISLLVATADTYSVGPPSYFPLIILFLIFFWLYNIIDAWRRAVMYNLALEGVENIELPDDMASPGFGGSLFGGAIVVAVSFVILLYTRFGMPITVIQEWWPLVPMALGGYLVVRAYLDKQAR